MTQRELMDLLANVEGWLTPRECWALFACARRCRGRGAIVEVGSWKGKSTIVLAAGARDAARTAVHAIDPHGGIPALGNVPTFDQFTANIARAGLTDLVRPHVQTSAEAAAGFKEPVEFIFIDGAHEYELVLKDFECWFPKVLEGGVMAFHDSVGWPGPRRVVRDRIYRSKYFRRIRFAHSLTYAEKVSANTALERLANRLVWWTNQCYAAAVFVGTRPAIKHVIERGRRIVRRSPHARV